MLKKHPCVLYSLDLKAAAEDDLETLAEALPSTSVFESLRFVVFLITK